jgi:hypothetical protein
MKNDAPIIENYMNPAYVLDGWIPKMAPIILTQPMGITAEPGTTVVFSVKVAAVPEAGYQWSKNDLPLKGATDAILTLKKISSRDAGIYTVTVKNDAGVVTSHKAVLNVK